MPNGYRAPGADDALPCPAERRDAPRGRPRSAEVAPDLKVEPLSAASLEHVLELEPEAILVDAAENAPAAFSVLTGLRERDARVPAAVIVERNTWSGTPGTRWPTSSFTRRAGGRAAGALAMLRRRAERATAP